MLTRSILPAAIAISVLNPYIFTLDCELYQSVDCQYLELTFVCTLCIIYIYVEEEVNRLCKQFPAQW